MLYFCLCIDSSAIDEGAIGAVFIEQEKTIILLDKLCVVAGCAGSRHDKINVSFPADPERKFVECQPAEYSVVAEIAFNIPMIVFHRGCETLIWRRTSVVAMLRS